MISLGTIEQHILLVQIVYAKFRRPLVGFSQAKVHIIFYCSQQNNKKNY